MIPPPIAVLLLVGEAAGGHGNILLWRVVNFFLLAALLGWLIRRSAGPFFAERGAAILREIAAARRQLEESEARAHAVEARLARLGEEIEQWKAKAKAEMAAEHARIERQTDEAVRKIFALGEQDIAAAAKAGRAELKAYTARLAVALAERKIASRMTPEIQRSLLASFIQHL